MRLLCQLVLASSLHLDHVAHLLHCDPQEKFTLLYSVLNQHVDSHRNYVFFYLFLPFQNKDMSKITLVNEACKNSSPRWPPKIFYKLLLSNTHQIPHVIRSKHFKTAIYMQGGG